jgi:hypothetical protein
MVSPVNALGFLDEVLLDVIFYVNRLPGWLGLGFPFGIGLRLCLEDKLLV